MLPLVSVLGERTELLWNPKCQAKVLAYIISQTTEKMKILSKKIKI